MGIYRVENGGKAPAGLREGDQVVTAGGTYTITNQNDKGAQYNAESGYYSKLTDKNQTLSSYQGTYANGPQTAAPSGGKPGPAYAYDPGKNEDYQRARQALDQAYGTPPQYQSGFDAQLNAIYEKIMNREPFSYDLNGDVLYQQYRDQYARNGQLAMMDSMGMAAALTGGYGSSYGQGVGQQSYNQYLQGLNEVVPELYDRAYNRYQQEGQDLLNQYSLTGDLRDAEYQQYQNALNNYWQNVNYLSGRADTAYERGYNDWYNNVSLGTETEEREYQRALEAAAATGDYSAMRNFGWTAQQIQSANRQSTGSGYTGTDEGTLQRYMDEVLAAERAVKSGTYTAEDVELLRSRDAISEEEAEQYLQDLEDSKTALEKAENMARANMNAAAIAAFLSTQKEEGKYQILQYLIDNKLIDRTKENQIGQFLSN